MRPILTTSFIHPLLKMLGNVLFKLRSERVKHEVYIFPSSAPRSDMI